MSKEILLPEPDEAATETPAEEAREEAEEVSHEKEKKFPTDSRFGGAVSSDMGPRTNAGG